MKRYKLLLLIVVGLLIFGCGDRSPLNILLDVDRIDATHFEVTDMTPAAWEKLRYYREESGRVFVERVEELRMAQEAFYNRHVDADGISIVGNDATHDVHFINAAKCILIMTAQHPEVREAYRNYFYVIVAGGVDDFNKAMPSGRFISDTCNEGLTFGRHGQINHYDLVPEAPSAFFASGTLSLGIVYNPDWTYPRAPLREYYGWTSQTAVNGRGDSMYVTTHEWAHALESGFNQFIPNFNDKLRHAYTNALVVSPV